MIKTKDWWRLLLLPLSILYGIGVLIRNGLYSSGLLRSSSFQIPIISIGNLSVGGTGKTPHIEYLMALLKQYVEVATLSRGYGRRSSGFRIVSTQDGPVQVGDEPLLLKLKHPDVGVFVGEDRVLAVPSILRQEPDTQVLLLDDAFQHRSLAPALNIVLTPFSDLYTRDFLLPMGRLREFRSGIDRADAVIVTKCPPHVAESVMREVAEEVLPQHPSRVFFSTIVYGALYAPFAPMLRPPDSSCDVLMLSAIANNSELRAHLETHYGAVRSYEFRDHHQFTKNDIANFVDRYEKMDSDRKIIVTTEKDLMRLLQHREYLRASGVPIFVLPISVTFLPAQSSFAEYVKHFLLDFKS